MDIVDLMISDHIVTIGDLQGFPVTVQKDPDALIEALGRAGKLSEVQQMRYLSLIHI